MRNVSRAAGCGDGYLFEVLESGKEPTLDRLLRVAGVLEVSITWLLYGFELSSLDEEFLSLFARLTPQQRSAVLALAGPPLGLPAPTEDQSLPENNQ